MRDLDVSLPDGRTLHAYDSGTDDGAERLVVAWHHGTPNIGLPPEPLFLTTGRLGIRWISFDRPGYGGAAHCLGAMSRRRRPTPPRWRMRSGSVPLR